MRNPSALVVRCLLAIVLAVIMSFSATAFSAIHPFVNGAIAAPLTPIPVQTSLAHANLSDPSGTTDLSGEVVATETPSGVQLQISVVNAPPSLHGIHIHEGDSCADNGNAAKGHFNPESTRHGFLPADGFTGAHAGDLGNFYIRLDGKGSYNRTISGLQLNEGKRAIANRAIILHAKADDLKTQPTGDAGGRIACGVLTPDA